ncbi:hypothetical protein FGRMN_4838 [Fusarium graminum]|nr:hypothetical protein FGRMN_4838 [Fusarium graminum]
MATIQNTTASSQPVGKTLYQAPSFQNSNPAVIRSVVNDEGLPEVVGPNHIKRSEYYDAPIPVDSESDKRFNEAPIPIDTYDSAPPLPTRYSTGTPQYYSQGGYAPQHQQHIQSSYPPQQQQHQGSFAPQQQGYGYSPQLQSYNSNEVVTYVTPLHELGDVSKFVDCPFCRTRAETRVKKVSSKMTHASAAVLGFTTIAGAVVPYAGNWASHVVHYCTNCDHKVAMRNMEQDSIAAGRRIYLANLQFPLAGNLPYEAKPHEIEEALVQRGFGDLDKIHISIDPVSARNPGYCFVDFRDREIAEKAPSSLRATVYGRPVKVGPCEPKKPRERRGFRDDDSISRRWGDWNVGSSKGGAPVRQTNSKGERKGPYWAIEHFEDMLRNPGGRRVYVGGLGKMVDETQHQEELAEIFTGFNPTAVGKRITPHESKHKLPGNHHYCFVDFDTKEEASSAAEALNGKEIPGGQLKVSTSDRIPQKLVSRQLDAREGRRVSDGMSNSRPNKPETNNAMSSINWRK